MDENLIRGLKGIEYVEALFRFGSRSTGKGLKPYSDTDLCVITNRKISLSEKAKVHSLVFSDDIDLVFFQDLPLHIKYRVFAEGEMLFVKNESFLREIRRGVILMYFDFRPTLRRHCERVLNGR